MRYNEPDYGHTNGVKTNMAAGDIAQKYQEATMRTAGDLVTMATTLQLHELSQLTLPEIEALSEEIARVVPAGNVPGLILSGLVQMEGRTVAAKESYRFVDMLFKGVQRSLDRMVYGAFFAGPAAVLYAYQQLLKMSGKQLDSAFPDGTWQFYLEFALREDTARHANETIGFHQYLGRIHHKLNSVDLLTCWLLTARDMLVELPDILANEWYERVYLRALDDIAFGSQVEFVDSTEKMYRKWEQQRPYDWSERQAANFSAYRRAQFETFVGKYTRSLNRDSLKALEHRIAKLEQTELPLYQGQLSWLSYLEPQTYVEKRHAYALEEAHIGVIYEGRYFLLPMSDLLGDYESVWRIAGAIIGRKHETPTAMLDDVLVTVSRPSQKTVRSRVDDVAQTELEKLRYTPVLINWDERDASQPLSQIREGKRGIGDHPLTIFFTNESVVFDQSHIYFDGAWGASVAQIMTNQAQRWADELRKRTRPRRTRRAIYNPTLQTTAAVTREANKAQVDLGTSAENTDVHLNDMLQLRRMLKQRNETVSVTVNDLLLLYRAIHATRYHISPTLQAQLDEVRNLNAQAYRSTLDAIATIKDKNPSILIPIDASRYNPRERLFPTTFRNPLTEFLAHHEQTLAALAAYNTVDGRAARRAYGKFEEEQAHYLRLIGGFGEVLARYRDIAVSGQSMSTASIKFLAHMPGAMQNLLDNIPGRFDVLNEIIKGEEVFSNVGRVVESSTLRRFITAKDDNTQKTLAWGVITDANNVVRMSLRDFRPHVVLWHEADLPDIAQAVTQDYLDAYVAGLNVYLDELHQIVTAQKPTGRTGFLSF